MKHDASNMIPKAGDIVFSGNSLQSHDTKNSHVDITNEENAQHFLWYQEYCSL